tara:strand:- start:610 stop:996 length:387 start_codon:yes stop_codon:yes gene_type:complete
MSENIVVNIVENFDDSNDNETFFLNNIETIENIINNDNDIDITDNNSDTTMAMQLEYSLNFNVKQLKCIANYYKINTRNMKKDEIIENIILFEVSEENQTTVYTRKRLWYFVEELKNDEYFNNIIFPF